MNRSRPVYRTHSFSALLLAWLVATGGIAAEPPGGPYARPVDYTRDVKPILSNRCYACHGPDEEAREADLRLDLREEAIEYGAIVPGNAEESALVDRISAADPDERMPPPDSNRAGLTAEEIEKLRRWIEAGAKFDLHWAYVPPRRPPVPPGEGRPWGAGPIDAFVAARQAEHGLEPSAEADRRTLLRRLSLDLVGLPPDPAEVDAFLADSSPGAYEEQVDRLLASPHFGERMAVYWLDVVRYADSGGYHSDNARQVWMYRDYVIRAFDQNKPLDAFIVEQLAGDLLPNATVDQRVASGYNRLLQTTEEGGAQPKEYTAKYAADRTSNTAAAFLGATLACAECHDHKFDPYTARDFYRFAAFFADVGEKAVGRQDQTPFPTPGQAAEQNQLAPRIAALKVLLETQTPELDAALAEWEDQIRKAPEEAQEAPEEAQEAPDKAKGPPENIAGILAIEPEKRNEDQKKTLAAHFRGIAPQLESERKELAELERKSGALESRIPSTLVTTAVEPRVVRVLPRGNWMDDSGEIVDPAIPAFLGSLDVAGRRATRLDFARWLVDAENPLVARVLVNRLWKLFFGRGIVTSLDDFGSQGALPTHPELLDWLAVELIESGWDLKHVVRLMATSSTYRQSSSAGPQLRERDPENRWLARQNSFRLDAEFVRDNALSVSGLLSPKIGGPSVKPYQPAGYWKHLNFPKRTWEPDAGESQYRRGLYTWWQRSFLHPSVKAFDASSREQCTVDRPRSNTPLQALTLLNDPTYVEAARKFAERILREGGDGRSARLAFAYRRALGREPRAEEIETLERLLEAPPTEPDDDEALPSKEILTVGLSAAAKDLDPAELVAWTSVARVILNLHETITRY